jgi:hypothetical protein
MGSAMRRGRKVASHVPSPLKSMALCRGLNVEYGSVRLPEPRIYEVGEKRPLPLTESADFNSASRVSSRTSCGTL